MAVCTLVRVILQCVLHQYVLLCGVLSVITLATHAKHLHTLQRIGQIIVAVAVVAAVAATPLPRWSCIVGRVGPLTARTTC